MNIKPRLHQPLAFNLIAALVFAVCFGARPGIAQDSEFGHWDTVTNPFSPFPVHSHMLPTGKVMMSPGDTGPDSGNRAQSWDPPADDGTTGSISDLATPNRDLFCSGHSFLADGKLFVAGGHNRTNGVGLDSASIYDPYKNTWHVVTKEGTNPPEVALMNAGRWYPTVTVLANGDVLVVSGSIDNTLGVNKMPQVWEIGTGTSRDVA